MHLFQVHCKPTEEDKRTAQNIDLFIHCSLKCEVLLSRNSSNKGIDYALFYLPVLYDQTGRNKVDLTTVINEKLN